MKNNKIYLVALVLLLSVLTGRAQVNPTSALVGSWSGQLNVGPMSLTLVLHLKQADGYVVATLDSPDQGAKGLSAEKEYLSDDSVAIKLDFIGMTYSARLKEGKLDGRMAWRYLLYWHPAWQSGNGHNVLRSLFRTRRKR